MLRASVISSLVLLAVHGDGLFRKRTAINIEARIREMIEKLLCPLTERVLEASQTPCLHTPKPHPILSCQLSSKTLKMAIRKS